MRIFVGFDSREELAYSVAVHSIVTTCPKAIVSPLKLDRVEQQGLLRRPRDYQDGRMIDVISQAPMSTEFAISRFLTPILAQSGWVLFVDGDIVAMSDVSRIMEYADDRYAVMCVKHKEGGNSNPVKMDGQIQTVYPRKNWSSVMLFNCDHPANQGLTLAMINTVPGRDLHRFCWLNDDEIGELPAEWNWLVNVELRPTSIPVIAHFTLGGPWFKDWKGADYDWLWNQSADLYRKGMNGHGMLSVSKSKIDVTFGSRQNT